MFKQVEYIFKSVFRNSKTSINYRESDQLVFTVNQILGKWVEWLFWIRIIIWLRMSMLLHLESNEPLPSEFLGIT